MCAARGTPSCKLATEPGGQTLRIPVPDGDDSPLTSTLVPQRRRQGRTTLCVGCGESCRRRRGGGRGWTWHTCGGAPGRALQGLCSQRAAEAAAWSPGAGDHCGEESWLHTGGFWRASAYLQSREAAAMYFLSPNIHAPQPASQTLFPLLWSLRFEHMSPEPLGL